MPKYTIGITETITYQFDVEADNERDAAKDVRNQFLTMNPTEQLANSMGVTDRIISVLPYGPDYDDADFEDEDETLA